MYIDIALKKILSFSVTVSTAIGALGDTIENTLSWIEAIQTILTIVKNIVQYPNESKYYTINTANPRFQQKYAIFFIQTITVIIFIITY